MSDLDGIADQLATTKFNSCTCVGLRVEGAHEASCPTDKITEACSALRASADLIRTATAFIEELKAFGYGETSDRALPGSYDAFVEALERVKQ